MEEELSQGQSRGSVDWMAAGLKIEESQCVSIILCFQTVYMISFFKVAIENFRKILRKKTDSEPETGDYQTAGEVARTHG